MIADDKLVLVHHDEKSRVTVTHLGTPLGGSYRETVDGLEEPGYEVSGEFSHPRIGADNPIRISLHPPPVAPPEERAYIHTGQQRADADFNRLRETFLRWAIQPPERG